MVPEEQPEMVKAGGGSDVGGGYAGWEGEEERDDLVSFPLPDVPQVASLSEPEYTLPPLPVEDSAWTFEKAGIYAMETMAELGETKEKKRKRVRTQATHILVVPPHSRRVMPVGVRRALLIFCVVGVLALLTDGILFGLSMLRHHVVTDAHQTRLDQVRQQAGLLSPTGQVALSPTSTPQVSKEPLLVLSAQRLAFSAVQGQSNLASQTVTLSANHQDFAWRIEPVKNPPPWLHLSVWQGSVSSRATASFAVNASPTDLTPGLYTASLLVKAFDARNDALTGSPVPLTVTLNVHPPCELSVAPGKLSFTAVLLSVPVSQTLTLSAGPDCALPASWQASADEPWVTFSSSSGTVATLSSGSSVTVQTNTTGKLIGTYTAHITVQSIDSSGVSCIVSPATITVTLTVLA